MPKPIITLLTDFGTRDYYVAAMKGVILSICPDAALVDITHEIAPFSTSEAAFTLAQSWRYFPQGTIHIVVVDPGVGSLRRPLVIEAGGHLFVGPDNGVFSLILQKAVLPTTRVLSNREFFLPEVSQTFHGRDIFAPVAAHLAMGMDPRRVGPLVSDAIVVDFAHPHQIGPGEWRGRVANIDRFGNIVTNFDYQTYAWLASQPFVCKIGSHTVATYAVSYSQMIDSKPLAIFGSAGFLEFSLNQKSLAAEWDVAADARIDLRRCDTAEG